MINTSFPKSLVICCLLLSYGPVHAQAGFLGAVVGGAVALVAAPIVLPAVGFTAVGITGGSMAASMMSAAATYGGGGVASMAAGGVVATLQSAAAGGAGMVIAGGAGVVTGALAGECTD